MLLGTDARAYRFLIYKYRKRLYAVFYRADCGLRKRIPLRDRGIIIQNGRFIHGSMGKSGAEGGFSFF